MDNWTREEKMAYYFWIDNLILEHWSEYLDLRLDYEADNEDLCEKKIKLINYYQAILDEVGKEFSWSELDDWYRKKYGSDASFIRYCRDLFLF